MSFAVFLFSLLPSFRCLSVLSVAAFLLSFSSLCCRLFAAFLFSLLPSFRCLSVLLVASPDKKPILFDVDVVSGVLSGKKKIGLLLNKQKIKIQVNNRTKIKDVWGNNIQMSCDFDNPKILKIMIVKKIHEFMFQDQKHRDCCALMIRANNSMEELKEHLDLEPVRGPQLGLTSLLRSGNGRKAVV
jgi:hypothetical protein